MEEILLGGQTIGQAQVTREGMYYRIYCRCRLSGEVAYKVQVQCGDNIQDLGLLAPENGAFCLTCRIPMKHLGEGEMRFTAIPRSVQTLGEFVPISVDEPFAYLARLENAYLERRNGIIGIRFSD